MIDCRTSVTDDLPAEWSTFFSRLSSSDQLTLVIILDMTPVMSAPYFYLYVRPMVDTLLKYISYGNKAVYIVTYQDAITVNTYGDSKASYTKMSEFLFRITYNRTGSLDFFTNPSHTFITVDDVLDKNDQNNVILYVGTGYWHKLQDNYIRNKIQGSSQFPSSFIIIII